MLVTKIECNGCGEDLVRSDGPGKGQLKCLQCDSLMFLAFHRKDEEIKKFRKKLGTLKEAKSFDDLIEELGEDFDSIMN